MKGVFKEEVSTLCKSILTDSKSKLSKIKTLSFLFNLILTNFKKETVSGITKAFFHNDNFLWIFIFFSNLVEFLTIL